MPSDNGDNRSGEPAGTSFDRFVDVLITATTPLVPGQAVIESLRTSSTKRTLARREQLLRAGDMAGHLFFVGSGLLRYAVIDPETGEERTGQFFGDGAVFTDAASFIGQTPATQSIEAVERSDIVAFPRAAIYAAYAADHAIERFGRLMLEAALIGSQRRSAALLTQSPEERYRAFMLGRPEIARRVPQYLVASYLGITPEALSRIRGRLMKRPGPGA